MTRGEKIAAGVKAYRAWALTGFSATAPEFRTWMTWKATASKFEIETAEFDAEFC